MACMQSGEVQLRNSLSWPFNNSAQTVALVRAMPDRAYTVRTEVVDASGDYGEIRISGKALNGFRIAYTGPCRQVTVRYQILEENGYADF